MSIRSGPAKMPACGQAVPPGTVDKPVDSQAEFRAVPGVLRVRRRVKSLRCYSVAGLIPDHRFIVALGHFDLKFPEHSFGPAASPEGQSSGHAGPRCRSVQLTRSRTRQEVET